MLSAPLMFPAFLYPNMYPAAFGVVTNIPKSENC